MIEGRMSGGWRALLGALAVLCLAVMLVGCQGAPKEKPVITVGFSPAAILADDTGRAALKAVWERLPATGTPST